MKSLPILTFVLAAGGMVFGQEREVPQDSARLTIPGCARGRTFIVSSTLEHETGGADVAPGRRFRLSGRKAALSEIKKREGEMVEVTGLVRRADLAGPGGVSLGGGIRIGGGPARDPIYADPMRDPGFNQAVFDVESWRPLPGSCPGR